MEGKARNSLLDYQATAANTKELFAHLRAEEKWIVRDDVLIKFLDRRGPLTVGYGSPDCTGVELEFGTAMGNHFDEPVLLIKAAWGGHSLFKLFRSPSAKIPEAMLQADLEQAQVRVKQENEKTRPTHLFRPWKTLSRSTDHRIARCSLKCMMCRKTTRRYSLASKEKRWN